MTEKILDALAPFVVPIASLNLDPRNARKHSDRNLKAIAKSLAEFGQRRLAVVQREGMVVRAGNGMVEAARSLGWEKIAALVVDEPEREARRYALADNRTAELAEWDREVLFENLDDLLTLGWDESDLAMMNMHIVDPIDAPEIPSGDREPFQQITFTLHDSQAERVKAALKLAKMEPFENSPNENSNGNALTRIVDRFLDRK